MKEVAAAGFKSDVPAGTMIEVSIFINFIIYPSSSPQRPRCLRRSHPALTPGEASQPEPADLACSLLPNPSAIHLYSPQQSATRSSICASLFLNDRSRSFFLEPIFVFQISAYVAAKHTDTWSYAAGAVCVDMCTLYVYLFMWMYSILSSVVCW